jgi:hypothetical protein
MSPARAVFFDLTGTLIEGADDPREPVREIAGALACLSALRAAGAKIAVVANVSEQEAEAFRRACPSLVALVDAWHLSYEAGAAKPSAAIFHAAFAADSSRAGPDGRRRSRGDRPAASAAQCGAAQASSATGGRVASIRIAALRRGRKCGRADRHGLTGCAASLAWMWARRSIGGHDGSTAP